MGLIKILKSLFDVGSKRSSETVDKVRVDAEKAVANGSQKASDKTTTARTRFESAADVVTDELTGTADELREILEPDLTGADEMAAAKRGNRDTEPRDKAAFGSSPDAKSTDAITKEGKEPMGNSITMTVNGREVSGECEDRTLLVQFIRENLGLTGTHVGCDTSQCGACVVHVDGRAVKSCTMLAAQASGCEVTTIEGIASGGELHPVQAAFKAHHGLQCGFCTPGMIMTATDMIRRHDGKLDEATVRAELEGNICRCTGYHNIVKAILAAAEDMGAGAKVAAE